MLGEPGTEQFTIEVWQDASLIRAQRIHDPFIHNTTTIAISRWDLFKALFRKQFITRIRVNIIGTEGVVRAIVMLDTAKLDAETQKMLADRARIREQQGGAENCYTAG